MRNTITDTITPFNKLNGATANMTNVVTLSMAGLIAVPIPTSASIGVPKAVAYTGRSTNALMKHPATVMTTTPVIIPMSAFFRVLFLL